MCVRVGGGRVGVVERLTALYTNNTDIVYRGMLKRRCINQILIWSSLDMFIILWILRTENINMLTYEFTTPVHTNLQTSLNKSNINIANIIVTFER